MYLAQVKQDGIYRYIIRQSYTSDGHLKSRDLFDLGPDPGQYIIYVGASGYYYSDEIERGLTCAGVEIDQNQLDKLLYDFLSSSIKRIIDGFDKGLRHSNPKAISDKSSDGPVPHLFDKRRYHYLRFGRDDQRYIERAPEKIFKPLYAKSRDELEQYFIKQERLLRPHENAAYVSAIFQLKQFRPETDDPRPLFAQMDDYFLEQLCALNKDDRFWADLKINDTLNDYLIKYAIMYFDFNLPRRSPWQAYAEDFINRHRIYHPPPKVKIKLEEAGRLFGMPWKDLKKLDKRSLSRLYRRLAFTHHPDQGGDAEAFRKLTQYYNVLSKRRR